MKKTAGLIIAAMLVAAGVGVAAFLITKLSMEAKFKEELTAVMQQYEKDNLVVPRAVFIRDTYENTDDEAYYKCVSRYIADKYGLRKLYEVENEWLRYETTDRKYDEAGERCTANAQEL